MPPKETKQERKLVALIRGINVGKAKRVSMAELKALLESFGWSEVKTLLNSGNVVFRAPGTAPAAAGARIEKGIAEQLGVPARVVVITADELEQAAAENPWKDEPALDPSRFLLAVLADPAEKTKLDGLRGQDWGVDRFHVGTRVAYMWCAGGILESKLPEALAKAMKDGVTSRNWATWQKLQALAAD